MSADVLNVALVGCGGMAQYYRTVYARLPGVKWTWAIDVDAATQAACRAEGAAHVSDKFEDCLTSETDVVVISTPNHLHAEQTVAALGQGKHVLLQKPIANTLAASDRIVQAAHRSDATAGMYMSAYEDPAVWEIKQLIDRGLLGQIQCVRAHDAHAGGLRAKPGQWRGSREQTGGGCCMQLSIHSINLMQWWLGRPITSVSAMSDNRLCPNIGGDDVTSALAAFTDGIYGVFQSGYASDGGTIRELHGTRGWVRTHHERGLLELQLDAPYRGDLFDYATPGQVQTVRLSRPAFDDIANPFNQHRMFVETLQRGGTPHMGVDHGRQDLQVVHAIYQAAELRRTVDVRAASPARTKDARPAVAKAS